MNYRSRASRGLAIFCLVVILIYGFGCLFSFAIYQKVTKTDGLFCSTSDPIYIELKANYQNWKDFFLTNPSENGFPSKTDGYFGIFYDVYYNHPDIKNDSIVVVIVRSPIESFDLNRSGYIYVENGQYPNIKEGYKTKIMESNFFCYYKG